MARRVRHEPFASSAVSVRSASVGLPARAHCSRRQPPRLSPEPIADTGRFLLRGTMTVAENRAAPEGRTIDLNLVVLPSARLDPSLPPVFHLDGGPGVPATNAVSWYATDGEAYWRDRDYVFVDQRGTGRSNPLHCDVGLSRADPFGPEYPPATVASCRDELSRIADLTCYGTADFIADLEHIRNRLRYRQIDLFGFSYGTRVGLAYLRAHPEAIRSAVLTGVLLPTARMRQNDAVSSQLGLEAVMAMCKADAACSSAFGDLEQQLQALLAQLRDEPPLLDLPDGAGQARLRWQTFMNTIRYLLYTPRTARMLPQALHAAAKGNWRPFLALRSPVGAVEEAESRLAEGLYLSILCSEDLPHFDAASAKRAAGRTWFGTERLDQALAAAELWPRGEAPGWLREYPDGDHPVLVINGGSDFVTPAANGEELARRLANATSVTIAEMGHFPAGLEGLEHAERYDELVLHFLDHQTVDGYPLEGLDDMRAAPFAVA
jgi:pimeloyl-ACP methyl ester carboxylesterase